MHAPTPLDMKKEQEKFKPPFCPNPHCVFHKARVQTQFYRSKGHVHTKAYPYLNRRFQCKHCLKLFSFATFQVSFREKKRGLSPLIFQLFIGGFSERTIARTLNVSKNCVHLRLKKLSKNALLTHALLLQNHPPLPEPYVYDGLESFSKNQYEPCHINHLVGKKTHFIYDFGFAPLNRKGRMTPVQKKKNKKFQMTYGIFPPRAIQKSTEMILKRNFSNIKIPIQLFTDEHLQYVKALQNLQLPIYHVQHSSKKPRDTQNPLFPVNHIDLKARHQCANFKRETIAFSKKSIALVQKYVLLMVESNYMRPLFLNPVKRNPKAHTHSPAMLAHVTKRLLGFKDLFKTRVFPIQVNLSHEWEVFLKDQVLFPRFRPRWARKTA